MIHPDIELHFISEEMGYGLFARRLIPRGTITWVRDRLDRAFTNGEIASLDPFWQDIVDKYTFVDRYGDHVMCWDLSRFMNHSCGPSSLYTGWDFEIALRDIAPGEELTDDYGTLNLEESFPCACGLPVCRKTILPDDLETHADRWDAQVRGVFPLLGTAAQPLLHLVPAADRDDLQRALADPSLLRSCIHHYAAARTIRRRSDHD